MLDLGRELRFGAFELRDADNEMPGVVRMSGYASVTGVPYEVGPVELGGWTETIRRGAFKRTLNTGENRALLHGHDNCSVLATTRAGTLRLVEDEVGLLVDADLDTRTSWVADLVRQMESGLVDEMSIGMYVVRDEWSSDWTERTVHEVRLLEASVVWAGANPATVAVIDRQMTMVREQRDRVRRADSVRLAAARAAAEIRLR